jgi:hypothetical protein
MASYNVKGGTSDEVGISAQRDFVGAFSFVGNYAIQWRFRFGLNDFDSDFEPD